MNTKLRDQLYITLLESPLGVPGVDQTLPALEDLLREVRSEKYWDGKPSHRLAEDQLIRAWATYRRDLRELRERLCQRQQDWDELLTWLAMFLIGHHKELAHVSAMYEPKFKLIFDIGHSGGMTPEGALAMQDDWQAWAVSWLRDALRDGDLDMPPASSNSGGDSGDGDSTPELSPTPKPDPDLEF